MKTALKWGNHVITTMLAILLFITLYCAVSSRVNGGTPTFFGRSLYEVLSGSMEPRIKVGSVIFDDQHVNTNGLRVGDVITFQVPHEPGLVVTHRIVGISTAEGQRVFQTKGDANSSKDDWQIPASDVIGQYSNVTIPYVGYYLNFLKTKLGVSLLMIVPGALLILFSILSLFREIVRLQKANGSAVVRTAEAEASKSDVPL
ncbi:signal peptidase I [Alicyclobacillus cycloheptanicus]|uniref:Signal peptidase I n=1 Tax=Alicyclobacillus cycloheptanicus TaxID=1457 RepID=A0ABT9XFH5_9BACL|nr:signal peptidase I [Alicyclobacillus cycloheptanicus]MDQ0188942.1 signal peptidase [Alicyclobacillus cycloheptanicus]WDM01709.1 signal peptidase I [Alicyclobacillus cycloheptanicus]